MKKFSVETSTSNMLIQLDNFKFISINRDFRLKGDKHFLVMFHGPGYKKHREITGTLKTKIVDWYLNDYLKDTGKYHESAGRET